MPVAVLHSRSLSGFDAPAVAVEVHLSGGLPAFNLVGLPETEVKESRDRVRAALQNAQFEFPARKITVNLAPADLPKESGRFDLPIALGILVATGQLPSNNLESHEFAGELALTGDLRPIRGALAMTLKAHHDGRAFVLPEASAHEAAVVRGAVVHPAKNLLAVCAHLAGRETLSRCPVIDSSPETHEHPDLSDVRGQSLAKRALEVAAAGEHSLLMFGPPGTGKSMLAQRLSGLAPPMQEDEALESAAVQSLVGGFAPSGWGRRPYRAPHHTASAVALVGGGSDPRPGEISLAHHGVLFLDELPEWDRRVLEVLREPMESGWVHISRAARQATFPARFQLVAAMNPCPCGYLGHPTGRCRCTPDQIARYRARISGPLLDRIDLQIEVPSLPADAMPAPRSGETPGETSATARVRCIRAARRQRERQGKPNGRLQSREVERYCSPDQPGEALLKSAFARLSLSARAYHRILKVARTVADLAAAERISAPHIAEAIGYRRLDRQ
ncbi:MAG TPA: YifB family Mg chelatase-like AAA ATPase [Casimicrobiaceae bacterium]|nr:YifB family Mg chelatase-like AAA ATPase [Casimicrobiaceae bacterium]